MVVSETPPEQKVLAQRLLIAVVAPVGLLLLVGLILGFQVVKLTDTGHWVDHSDEVLGRLGEIQTQIVDQETGIRGFLLSNDRAFLEPYERAQPLPLFATVRLLVADNSPQQVRCDVARGRYEEWLKATRAIVEPGSDLNAHRQTTELLERKRRTDSIRESLQSMLLIEQGLRVERAAAYADSNRLVTFLGIPLFIALAIALAFLSRRQLNEVSSSYRVLLEGEQRARQIVEAQNWIRTQHVKVAEAVQGDPAPDELGRRALGELCVQIGAVAAAFFVAEPGGFRRRANLGLSAEASDWFADAEGLVGRAALAQTVLHVKELPREYVKIESGTGAQRPAELVLLPACLEGKTLAVLEFAFFAPIDARALELLNRVSETIAVALRSVQQKERLADLLKEAQRQGEELQTQQEELRVVNEELEEQGDVLRHAHAQLEEGKEELEASNANLSLQRDALEKAQRALTEKMAELEKASRYKSEFLAKMSHELRTPLNSSLILAKLLADNGAGNLNAEQVKFANTIYSAGNDLGIDQRHPRFVEDRSRQGRISPRADQHRALGRAGDSHVRAGISAEKPGLFALNRGWSSAHRNRRAARAAGAEEPALQCLQVHRTGHGLADRGSWRRQLLLRRPRHRHRHRRGASFVHLRGLSAGRWHHQSTLRRHGPRPIHLA